MNKIKVVSKLGLSQLILKSLKGQQINENEVYAINSNKVAGLLHLDVVQKGTSFKFIYNITGFITLKDYLTTPLNKERFAMILQNILSNLQSMEKAFFNQQYLLMDFNRVMVNPATQHIYFIYVPIQYFESGTSLRDFLLNIIQHATFAPGEDTSYVKDYITILNNGINFSVFDLEEYINNLLGQKSKSQRSIECPQCHTRLDKGTNYCPACGAKVSGNTGMTGKGVYDPLQGTDTNEGIESEKERYERKDNTQGLSDGTTVLGTETGGTTVLGSEELYRPQYPYLIREKNGEKISVDKPSFRIGKEKKFCDYFVADNNAVSRSHADIITREKRYYIVDLNSTNKTYVDNRVIPVEIEMEIFSGAKLKLANEEFVFYID